MEEKVIEGQTGELHGVAEVSCQPSYVIPDGQVRDVLIGGMKRFADTHPRAARHLSCITIIGLAATAIIDAGYVLVAAIDDSRLQPKAAESVSIS